MNPPVAAAAFLADAGWGDAALEPLAGDASFRRYFRCNAPGRQAVLMDAPPPHEDPAPFLRMAGWLHARGYRAPAILAQDLAHGLVLLEDFGDARLREAVEAAPDAELRWYGAAVDLLVRLAREPAADVPPYDAAVYRREVGLLVDWYCPAVGLRVDADGYHAAWEAALGAMPAAPPVTVLRDYHAENLMLLDGGELGLLDFQDALVGHPAYDLVSLLQDARRDVPETLEAAMLQRYHDAARPGTGFDAGYRLLGAQRNAKIVGLFTRLWQRDGKARYPAMCPRVWRYLERDLAHPALAPVAAWMDANIPADKRGDPMVLA